MNPCDFIILPLLLLLIMTKTSSQLVVVEGDDTNDVMNKCLDKERDALLRFKAPLHDPNSCLSTWKAQEHDCCQWSGVTCDEQTGHVTGLHIAFCSLEGEISPSLLNLSSLNSLFLSENSFHGTIPKSIGSLTKLEYLDLSKNSLHGTVPPEFGNLTNLQQLYLSYMGRCRVENTEWLSRLSHLEVLVMDGISLAKADHWVDAISNLQNLSSLSLDGCELSQVLYPSSSFLNSSSSVDHLSLRNNSLTSSIGRWLFPLTGNKLRFLDLSNNMLDGIPKYLGNLCSLDSLGLANNSVDIKLPYFLSNLSGCTSLALQWLKASHSQFTGSLSDEIQKFTSLEYVDLSHNQLNGTISQKLWEHPRLQILDISFNNLQVPSTYHNMQISHENAIQIDMSYCKLGPHFPKWIQALKTLSSLDISNTGISDTTPLDFWESWPSRLSYLNLSSNNISGKVPDLSSNFGDYSKIDLSSNNFHGPIPKVHSTLSSLNLSRNKFSGGISFICQIVDRFLSFLDLSHNSFTGQLPDCLWHFEELNVLNLGHNNLFGRISPSIGSLTQLMVLSLYNNNFSGELPLSLKNCTSLKSLNLGANNFSGNVPVGIGENLSGLHVLIIRSNNFFGTIPSTLCQLGDLQILDLSINNLHGNIPSCLSNLTSMVQQGFSEDVRYIGTGSGRSDGETYIDNAMIGWQGREREFFSTLKLLKSIDLSSNHLTGKIPYKITNLSDLIVLNLSRNTLFGQIPSKIGEMKRLLTLDLSRNNLSGGIPLSMSRMTLLNDLDLSYNIFSGRIPSSTQLQSFESSRYDGNPGLCGPPLSKKCPGYEESELPSTVGKSEDDSEDIDEVQIWFYTCGGIGFGTGFWIACGALLINRRGRDAFFNFYDRFKNFI